MLLLYYCYIVIIYSFERYLSNEGYKILGENLYKIFLWGRLVTLLEGN